MSDCLHQLYMQHLILMDEAEYYGYTKAFKLSANRHGISACYGIYRGVPVQTIADPILESRINAGDFD